MTSYYFPEIYKADLLNRISLDVRFGIIRRDFKQYIEYVIRPYPFSIDFRSIPSGLGFLKNPYNFIPAAFTYIFQDFKIINSTIIFNYKTDDYPSLYVFFNSRGRV